MPTKELPGARLPQGSAKAMTGIQGLDEITEGGLRPTRAVQRLQRGGLFSGRGWTRAWALIQTWNVSMPAPILDRNQRNIAQDLAHSFVPGIL